MKFSKKINVRIDFIQNGKWAKIVINGITHLKFSIRNYDGFHAWTDQEARFKWNIEINRKRGLPIRSEYTSFEKWEKIIQLLDQNL